MGSRKAVVLGGGVIGLSTALRLQHKGFDVQLVEQYGTARGASIANAGWAEAHSLQPLPSPSTLKFGLSSVLRPNAPLYIKPRASLSLLAWLAGFALSSTGQSWEHGRAALQDLAAYNGVDFGAFVEQLEVEIASRSSLSVYGTSDGAELRERELGALGSGTTEVLDRAELKQHAPFLSSRALSALRVTGDVVLEPAKFMAGMRAVFRERQGEIVSTRAVGFRRDDGRVTQAITTTGELPGDVFVIACGYESPALLRSLGSRLSMQAGKGFSVELDLPFAPHDFINLADAKVGIAPHGAGARLVGTMELSGPNENIDDRRVEGILDAAEPYLASFPAEARDPANRRVLIGQRPMTSNGLPVIDRVPKTANAFVSTGHAMMGLSLGLSSAEALSDFITTGNRPSVLSPFRHPAGLSNRKGNNS